MIKRIKELARNHLTNSKGWRTDRKIIVIESDDWGAIRLPNVGLLQHLKDLGIQTGRDPMLENDALASEDDLQKLFETLKGISRRKNFAPPSITANTIVANPDFDKIEEGSFDRYYFEPFTDTLKRYPSHQASFNLWKQGIEEGVFHPQFHGREHLHVRRWMEGLQKRNSETARLFNKRLYAVCGSASTEQRKSYLAAYEWDSSDDRTFTQDAIKEGLDLFESIFGYRSRSAIAPNYTWHRELERVYSEGGVRYLQGATVQRSPNLKTGNNDPIRHFMGEKNDVGQRYLIRNCRFEPALDPGIDNVGECMNQIKTAFLWRKPAIIESHRVNYIGYINSENRDDNLKLFRELLGKIIEAWPDVEFMKSDQLGESMDEEIQKCGHL